MGNCGGPSWAPLCATLCFRAGAAAEGRPYNDDKFPH
jgi:hypothetical protein